jgi:MFS family permease
VVWRYPHTVLALGVLVNFGQVGSRLVISPVVPAIIERFGVTRGTVGLVLTGMWGAYALSQFPSGVLADRVGERRVILAALALTALGSLLLAAAPSFLLFGAFAVFLGSGAGLYTSVGSSLLTKLFDDTGGALGLHVAGGSLAGFVAPVTAAYVGVRYGWRAAVLLGAVVLLPVLGLAAWRLRPTPPASPGASLVAGFAAGGLRDRLRRADIAFTVVVAALGVFTWQSVASFLPTFLVEYRSLSTGEAATAFGAVFLLSAVGQPVAGRLSDALGRDTLLATNMVVAGSALLLLVVDRSALALVAAVLLLGGGLTWFGVVQARFMDRLDAAGRGTGFGLVRTVYMSLGALGSVVTGTVADVAGWAVAFALVAGLLGLAALTLAANRALSLGL